jgi:phospholipid/cholesterol/gamma-HCH transport system permease protein
MRPTRHVTLWIEAVGYGALTGVRFAAGLHGVFARTLVGTVRGRREKGEVLQQMYEVGNRSLLFAVATLGFIGMVLVFQTCLQVTHITGDLSRIGADWVKILVHEFGPTLTAMMLATRVGAGIAAEVGSMVVTEQVDALRMCGVDPIDYLIVPRFIACILMNVIITVFAVVVALALGTLIAYRYFHVNPELFVDTSAVRAGDVLLGLCKCICYGAAIPTVSGTCGLSARGGSEGVGTATTRAVIGSSFAIIVLDFILSSVGFAFMQE